MKRSVSFRRPWVLIPTSATICVVGGWSIGAGHPLAAGFALAAGVCSAAAAMADLRAASRLAAQLCGDKPAESRPLGETLADLAVKLEGLDQRLAQTHPITRLPTREYLLDAVAADIAREDPQLMGAIRFVDFDRLAAFDQAAANAALQNFALRLVNATRPCHIISQTDRDCFVIWFRHTPDLAIATAEFRAIVHVAGQELVEAGVVLAPTVEIAAVHFPRDGRDADHLLLRVTAALKRPERSHAGEILLAELPSVEHAREQFSFEQDLAQAIAEDQLTMVFQPVVDTSVGQMIGAEALLRWDHPRLGAISPARFIPLVETLGLSERYGLWVLNAACREARRWQDEGLDGLKVAVNLSARQLLDPGLRTKIERTLGRHGLKPQALELELTETAAMADAQRTFELFGELHAMGVSLAIDDFGSGYSSLSYLKNLPFDKLKIDREFVMDVDQRRDSRAICRALIELGHGLDLLVLAEGVETPAEVAVLQDLGCRVFQGFHFSKPLAADAFRALANDPSWPGLAEPAVKRRVPA